MSCKSEVEEKVKAIVAKGKDVDANIVSMVKKDFAQTVEDSKKAGTTLKSATYDTLEGIEEGLKNSTYKTEEILKKSADAMVEVTKEISQKSIQKSAEVAQASKDAIHTEMEKTHESIDQVNSKLKDKMKSSYEALKEKNEAEKENLKGVAEGFKEYTSEKGHHILSKSVDKTKEAIAKVDNSFKEHSKRLLDHSEEKVASWFHSMANKIKKH